MFKETKVNQILATSTVTFGGIWIGLTICWSATALPDYEKSGILGTLTATQRAWMASLAMLGAVVAAAIGGRLVNTLGRKRSLILYCGESALGWFCLVVASRTEHVYFGRFLSGMASGGYCVVVPIFIREISSPDNRGALGSMFVIMMCLGKLLSNSIGTIMTASGAALISFVHPIFHGISILYIPESPVYLIQKERTKEAQNALRWLNLKGFRWPWTKTSGDHFANEMEAEINATVLQITETNVQKMESLPWKTCFTSGAILKPTFTAFLIMILYQLSGTSVLTFYTLDIFAACGEIFISPKIAIVVISALQTLACFPTYLFVDKFGRKFFLLSSFAVMASAKVALAAFFFLKDSRPHFLASHTWLEVVPPISVLAFYLGFCWGLGNVAFITVSEILPPQVGGIGSAICTIIYWAGAFLTTQFFQMYIETIPMQLWFLGFAGVNIFGGLFTIFCLPETKGLTLEEIQGFYSTSQKQPRKHSNDTHLP